MARKTSKRDRTSSGSPSVKIDATVAILAVATIVMAVAVSPAGYDVFRLPKELAFRATALLLGVAGVFAITSREWTWDRLRAAKWDAVLVTLIIIWAGITTLTSTNRMLSYDSLITVICAAAIFLAARLSAARIPILVFDLLIAAACVNAVIVALQEFGIWNPFKFGELVERHSRSSAFIGNPNDVGAYLVGPAVAVMVAAVIARGYRRWVYVGAGLILAVGLIATQTR